MRIIRPCDPEFSVPENFSGRFGSRPVSPTELEPKAFQLAINIHSDNFRRQTEFNRQMLAAYDAQKERIRMQRNCLLAFGILLLIALGLIAYSFVR